jgi:hypothetical protein
VACTTGQRSLRSRRYRVRAAQAHHAAIEPLKAVHLNLHAQEYNTPRLVGGRVGRLPRHAQMTELGSSDDIPRRVIVVPSLSEMTALPPLNCGAAGP